MTGHISQLTASLGQSYYFVIIVKSYRGYSDACIYLEKIIKTFKTLTVIIFQVLRGRAGTKGKLRYNFFLKK